MTLYEDNTATFFGDTFINAGTLALSGNGTLSTNGTVTVALGAVFDISASAADQTIGALAGAGSVALGTISLETGGSGSSTVFSGTFSGSGTLTKTGAGEFVLSGNNLGVPYTGAIVVNGGTLSVSSNNNFGTGTLTIDGASLQMTGGAFSSAKTISILNTAEFDVPSGTATLSGVISGTGVLSKISSGTLVLSGANNYSGGTEIQQGTLSLGSANTLPLSQNVTLAGSAILALNDNSQQIGGLSSVSSSSVVDLGSMNTTVLNVGSNNSSASFAGTIIGAGSLLKTGTGTQIILGSNTYSGGTTVSAGILEGNSTSLSGAIFNNAGVVFNQTFDGTFGGTVLGTGVFTKEGTETLTLQGGFITQTSGVFEEGSTILNELFSGNITIQSGATLEGLGPVAGSVTNFGSLAPGNLVGTFSIANNYFQKSGSFLEIAFNPLQSDRLNAAGAATIESSTTLILSPDFGVYAPNTNYIILQAAGGLTGQFPTVQISLPSFGYNLAYSPTTLLLTINIVPFTTIVNTGNAGALARCLDTFPITSEGDIGHVIDLLHFMTLPQLLNTLNQMQPSLFNSLSLSEEENLIQYRLSLVRRLNDLYFDSCSDGKMGHFWIDFFSFHPTQKNQGNEPGYHAMTQTTAVGFDYFLTPEGYLGWTGGYAIERFYWKQGRGSAEIDGFYQGIYGGWRPSYFYIQGSIIGSYKKNKATRVVDFITVVSDLFEIRKANHSNSAFSADSYAEIGVNLGYKKARIRPFSRIDFVYVHQTGFEERGAQSIDLDVDSQNSNLLRAEWGADLSVSFESEEVICTPYVKFGYGLERRFSGKNLNAHLVGSDCTFTVNGLHPQRQLLLPSGGILLSFCKKPLELGFEYEGEYSKKYHSYTASGKLQLNF